MAGQRWAHGKEPQSVARCARAPARMYNLYSNTSVLAQSFSVKQKACALHCLERAPPLATTMRMAQSSSFASQKTLPRNAIGIASRLSTSETKWNAARPDATTASTDAATAGQ